MLAVGFDGRALVSPAAGVRRYTWELFGALAGLSGVRVVAVGAPDHGRLPDGVERGPTAASLPGNPGWMFSGLPRAARRAGIGIFHAPSYTAPFRGPRPLVLTIHDVSYERRPEWYPHRRDPVRRAFYRWSARTADRIITDSAFSRTEIVAAYGLPPDRIDVVPLASADRVDPGDAVSLPVGIEPPYVLHVGDLHPRRNLEVAAKAVLALRRQSRFAALQLVLVGVDRGSGDGLRALSAGESSPAVRMLGHVDESTLAGLYLRAAALVYPSRYEGFGLPLLEAMSAGTPVIASRAASIPEVVGDAAVLLDPDDGEGWVRAIEQISSDQAAADRWRAAGRRRAAAFSWRRTAEATLDVYRRTLAEHA